MKISNIQQICKSAKHISLYTNPNTNIQWISDGYAMYPLYNLPELERENIFTLFDIPENKQDKIRFEHKFALPGSFDFRDSTDSEMLLEQGNISIYARGRVLLPLKTSMGIVYIGQKYLSPFKDAENGVQLYERITPSGTVYVAVKEGFLLTGIISPFDIITNEFVDELKLIYTLSALSAENKKCLRTEAEAPEQMNFDQS